MKFSYEINVFGVLLALIAFFAVAKLNEIDQKLEKINNLENRITRVETKLFGDGRDLPTTIIFPKVYACLSCGGKKKRELRSSLDS